MVRKHIAQAALETVKEFFQAKLKRRPAPVLFEGEAGVGKTTLARWFHANGPRAAAGLREVSCLGVPESILEAELFGGHGGGRTRRMGMIAQSDGGTILIEDLSGLSLRLQSRLHRLMAQGVVETPDNQLLAVDVQVLATSTQPLMPLAASGQWRMDLAQRFDLFRFVVPPLRTWGEDIAVWAQTQLEGLKGQYGISAKTIHADGLASLRGCHWPGNLPELANELTRALVFESGNEMRFEHLRGAGREAREAPSSPDWLNPGYVFGAESFSLQSAIDRLVALALKQTNNNVSAAARLLGITRDQLRYRLSESPQARPQENGEPPGRDRA